MYSPRPPTGPSAFRMSFWYKKTELKIKSARIRKKNITDSCHTKCANTFVLEAEVMAEFHEICKNGVLHYFTFYCCYFWTWLCSHCIHFYYQKGWHFDSKDVALKEVNNVEPFNLIMNDLSEMKSCWHQANWPWLKLLANCSCSC